MTCRIPPPPRTGGVRPVALFDTECYPNYWLLMLMPIEGQAYSLSIANGQAFAQADVAFMDALFDAYTVVSFNGNYYDVGMLRGARAGHTTDELKYLNDSIIPPRGEQGLKPWELGLGEWEPPDHIDLMPVCPGAGSQNQFAARIHHHTLQDLPYEVNRVLTYEEMQLVAEKCANDLLKLKALYLALAPQLRQRERLGQRYGMDLRSKSDAQVAEAVLRKRCEQATGQRIDKPRIDWNLRFTYTAPAFISFEAPQLRRALQLVNDSIFSIRAPLSMREAGDDSELGKCIAMPPQLEGLEIIIGQTQYKMGVGGLHSQEKKLVAVSNETHQLRMPDVASYYPNLMVNAGAWPPALGQTFVAEFEGIKRERIADKAKVKALKKAGDTSSSEYADAVTGDGGGKIMINGTFGKTGSPYSVLFAPQMLIQTTVTGQLSLLMLIEWHEAYGIPVISANTDGLVIYCPRDRLHVSEWLIEEWEKRTGLEMETDDYLAIYARDVNTYFAIKTPDDVKRKGEVATSGLIEKKNPDVEICSDAVAAFLAKGTPIEQTILACRDIRKFIAVQKVAGGGVKMWGEGPRKGQRVVDMVPTLEANGWAKRGVKWARGDLLLSAADAYAACFAPRRPEYMGKVVRWYYGTRSPGPIVYASNGNTVGGSYGARPCMTLPETFPDDVNHAWYIGKALDILKDVGFSA